MRAQRANGRAIAPYGDTAHLQPQGKNMHNMLFCYDPASNQYYAPAGSAAATSGFPPYMLGAGGSQQQPQQQQQRFMGAGHGGPPQPPPRQAVFNYRGAGSGGFSGRQGISHKGGGGNRSGSGGNRSGSGGIGGGSMRGRQMGRGGFGR